MGYCRFDMRLWSSPRVIEALTSADQYLLFYLFTTPHTSFNGCCHINFRTLSFETGLDQEKIRHCLKRLYESGFILYCDGTKEAFVKGWISCNWGGAPRRGAKIYQAIQLIKSRDIQSAAQAEYTEVKERRASDAHS